MVDTDAELFPLVDSIGGQPARPSSLSSHVDALGLPGVPGVPARMWPGAGKLSGPEWQQASRQGSDYRLLPPQ